MKQTKQELFVTALIFAIEAPADEQKDRAVELAESIGSSLTPDQINQGKEQARVICEINRAQSRTLAEGGPVILQTKKQRLAYLQRIRDGQHIPECEATEEEYLRLLADGEKYD